MIVPRTHRKNETKEGKKERHGLENSINLSSKAFWRDIPSIQSHTTAQFNPS
jgi:hypothetical protein